MLFCIIYQKLITKFFVNTQSISPLPSALYFFLRQNFHLLRVVENLWMHTNPIRRFPWSLNVLLIFDLTTQIFETKDRVEKKREKDQFVNRSHRKTTDYSSLSPQLIPLGFRLPKIIYNSHYMGRIGKGKGKGKSGCRLNCVS